MYYICVILKIWVQRRLGEGEAAASRDRVPFWNLLRKQQLSKAKAKQSIVVFMLQLIPPSASPNEAPTFLAFPKTNYWKANNRTLSLSSHWEKHPLKCTWFIWKFILVLLRRREGITDRQRSHAPIISPHKLTTIMKEKENERKQWSLPHSPTCVPKISIALNISKIPQYLCSRLIPLFWLKLVNLKASF